MGRSGATAWFVFAAASAALAGGCRHAAPPGGAGAVVPASGPVHGRVVDRQTRLPLAARTVVVGRRRVTTDAAGAFALDDAPGVYDLTVLDATGEIVTVYRGLSRRDPLLVHASKGAVDERNAKHSAKLFPAFTVGGQPLAADVAATFGFFAPTLGQRSERCAPALSAGQCEPLALYWNQPASLAGDAFAVAIADRGYLFGNGGVDGKKLAGWAVRRAFTVASSTAPTLDLALAPMPVRHVSGEVEVPVDRELSAVVEAYRLAVPGADIPLLRVENSSLRALEQDLPDLTSVGASLCITAFSDGDGVASTTRCGVGAAPITVALSSPPRLTAPAHQSAFEASTSFAWTPFADGVQALALGGEHAANHPDVTIFAMTAGARWSDVAAAGVAFPKGCAIYQVTAGGYGPFRSMDEAFGPGGVGAQVPSELRWSESAPITITVPRWPRAEPGTFEAKLCHYPYGRGIVCAAGKTVDDGEYYMLSAINNKLRRFPAFAMASGIYCVRDCETARRFTKAYRDYSALHPGFDEHEPLDMEEC